MYYGPITFVSQRTVWFMLIIRLRQIALHNRFATVNLIDFFPLNVCDDGIVKIKEKVMGCSKGMLEHCFLSLHLMALSMDVGILSQIKEIFS